SPMLLPFIAATICGLVGVWVPQILGLGIDSINDMIAGEFALSLLITVLVAKVLMTALCLGCGLFGGVFSPSLFIGVATGALAGQTLTLFGFADIASIISIAAMAAVSAAVIGAPLSAVLIVLELTQSYEYAVAAMMAVMLCGLLTHRLFGQSFFDRQLLDRGVDLAKGREAIALSQQMIGPFASDDYITAAGNTAGTLLLEEMTSRAHTEAYIIDDAGKLMGKITIYQVIECGAQEVSKFMDVQPLCLYADEPLDSAMVKVSQFVGESLPVIDRNHRIMHGCIAEGALFQAVIDIQAQARNLERA
ncbi:MAG: chloride channel protein, partial [Porticoccaceae bacterium]